MKVNRRRFLGFSAGAAAGAALGVPAGRSLATLMAGVEPEVYPPRGPEDSVLSVCGMCPGGCGIRVRRVGKRVVRVDGNPLHPVNRGRLCPRGQAAVQSLLHPDRLAGPLRRRGPKGGAEGFEPVSWEEALTALAERLSALRAAGRPEGLVLLHGARRGLGMRLALRFLEAYGSPNHVAVERGEEAAALALLAAQEVRATPAFDVQSTDYVLSFDAALLEAWSSPVFMAHSYGAFRQERAGSRGKLVQVSPRLSLTAGSADEWVAVRPGTEGVLALGIARVIVAEGLHDRGFLAERTRGLEPSADPAAGALEGLRAFLTREYSLESVAARTGVAGNVILRLAREFAGARASVAIGPRRGPLLPGRLFDHLAVGVLNALVGSIDAPGGVLLADEVPLRPWPPLPADEVRSAGLSRARAGQSMAVGTGFSVADPEALADWILEGGEYPVEAIFVLGADPVFTSAAPARMAAALERVPTVVSFASLLDDTALYADWVLPETHFLESWDLDTTAPGVPFPTVTLAQPVAEPWRDARPVGTVFLDLAQRLGSPLAEALPWSGLEELVREEVEGLYEARRGAIMGTEFDEAWVRMMERAGWWAPGYGSASELLQRMLDHGGWWDPFYDHADWPRVLRTDSGRVELRTDLLSRLGAEIGEADRASGDSLPLVLFEPLPVAGGRGAELPFLQEILDPAHEARWETWVEVHAETAARLRLTDRQWVRLTSPAGTMEAQLRVTSRIVPETVAVPLGLGKMAGGRWAEGVGANPLRLMGGERDPGSGLPDFTAIRVTLAAGAGPEEVS